MAFIYEGMAMIHEGSWAMEEFAGADMGDARLTKRLIKLADRQGDAPGPLHLPVMRQSDAQHRLPVAILPGGELALHAGPLHCKR